MVNLKQLANALQAIGVDIGNIVTAEASLQELLDKLERIPVQGRNNVDTMLGCMMAVDAILGKERNKNG